MVTVVLTVFSVASVKMHYIITKCIRELCPYEIFRRLWVPETIEWE
jgi:hypothetical protein